MHRRLSVARVVAAVLATAAGVAAPATARAQVDGSGDVVPTAPKIEVLDAGAEPRVPLRYALTAGASYTATQTVDQRIEQIDDEGFGNTTEVPSIDLGMRLDVIEVLLDGTARVALAFTSVDATGTGSAASADQALFIEIALGDITDLTGETVLTDRGAVLESSYDVPEDLPVLVRSVLEQVESQMAALTPPLPEEPLGVGARWRATTQVTLSGITVEQDARFTLESITDTGVEVSVSLRQRADRQEIDVPNAPRRTSARLLSYRGTGDGTSTFDLRAPVPVASEVAITVVNRVRTRDADGDVETVRTTSEQEQRITTP